MRINKIAHYPKENERAIFREDGENKQRLAQKNTWTKNEEWALRFLNKEDCLSSFIHIKFLGGLKTDEELIEQRKEEIKIKQSWSEL